MLFTFQCSSYFVRVVLPTPCTAFVISRPVQVPWNESLSLPGSHRCVCRFMLFMLMCLRLKTTKSKTSVREWVSEWVSEWYQSLTAHQHQKGCAKTGVNYSMKQARDWERICVWCHWKCVLSSNSHHVWSPERQETMVTLYYRGEAKSKAGNITGGSSFSYVIRRLILAKVASVY